MILDQIYGGYPKAREGVASAMRDIITERWKGFDNAPSKEEIEKAIPLGEQKDLFFDFDVSYTNNTRKHNNDMLVSERNSQKTAFRFTPYLPLLEETPVVLPEGIPTPPRITPNTTRPYGAPEFPGENPAKAPDNFDWLGRPNTKPGDKGGSYVKDHKQPTQESLKPDLEHTGKFGPHWDWKASNGQWYRIFPDNTVSPKEFMGPIPQDIWNEIQNEIKRRKTPQYQDPFMPQMPTVYV